MYAIYVLYAIYILTSLPLHTHTTHHTALSVSLGVDRKLLNLMMSRFHVRTHLLALKKYLLLGQVSKRSNNPQIYTYIRTYTHIHTYIHIHTHIHTYIHTYTHTYIHTHIHTYIHTHLLALKKYLLLGQVG
jgi:hypothetical protein